MLLDTDIITLHASQMIEWRPANASLTYMQQQWLTQQQCIAIPTVVVRAT
jgi:hypothetical protein